MSYRALEEEPYLDITSLNYEDLEEELSDNSTLMRLRNISKSLVKNSSVANSIIMAYLTSFMSGEMKVNLLSKDYSIKKFEKHISPVLNAMDINQTMSLTDFNDMLIKKSLVDGDVLINMPISKENPLETIVELIPASRIDTPMDKELDPYVINGVRYNKQGKVVSYYIRPTSEKFKLFKEDEYTELPVYTKIGKGYRRNCFLFVNPLTKDIETGRGIPPFTSVSKLLRYFDSTNEAIVISTRVAACMSGFITKKNPGGAIKGNKKRELEKIGKLQPGTIYYLNRGESVNFSTPQRPADNVESYLNNIVRLVGSRFRLPYQFVNLDLNNVSYSSWKGGANEVASNKNRWNTALTVANKFVINNFILSSNIKNKTNIKTKYSLRFPNYEPLDKTKVAKANQIELENSTTSIHRIADDENQDYDTILKERTEEEKDKVEMRKAVLAHAKSIASNDIEFEFLIGKEDKGE